MKLSPQASSPLVLGGVIATSTANKIIINDFFDSNADFLCSLRDRWQDEKEYEDISDYSVAMKKKFPQGFNLVKFTKAPFGFTFTLDLQPGATYRMSATARSAKWERIS